MCIIIAKPQGTTLTKDIYDLCFEEHPHGAGIAYVKDKKLIVDKGYWKASELYAAIAKEEQREMLIHFRTANRGCIDDNNCHPYLIQVKGQHSRFSFAVVHNGTLKYHSTTKQSDTHCFVNEVIAPSVQIDPWWFDRAANVFLLEEFMGWGNKICIMRYDSEKDEITNYILNEIQGNKAKGCWFSNYSWKKVAPVIYGTGYGPTGMGHYHGSDYYNYSGGTNGGTGVKHTAGSSGMMTPYALSLIEKADKEKAEKEAAHAKALALKGDDTQGDTKSGQVEIFPSQKQIDEHNAKVQGATNVITVPRDPEVADGPEQGEDLTEAKGLWHLGKREKKKVGRFCSEVCKKMGFKKGHETLEKLVWVREKLREFYPDVRCIANNNIDHMIAADMFTVEEFLRLELREQYMGTREN